MNLSVDGAVRTMSDSICHASTNNRLIGTTGSLSSSVTPDLMQFAPVEIRGDIVFQLNEEEDLANLISSGSSSLVRKRLVNPAICMNKFN